MTWHPNRVVVVGRRAGGAVVLLGSGAVVADQRVLTARHVVLDKSTAQSKPDLVVRRDGSDTWLAATVAWSGAQDCDAAILSVPAAREEQVHPLALLAAGDVGNRTAWYARGYPMVGDAKPSEELTSLKGTTHAYFAGESELRLGVDEPPANCKGLSGGAVIVGDRIVALVKDVARPDDWKNKLLHATPVASLCTREDFLSAMGVRPGNPLHCARIEAVRKRIEDQLRGAGQTCARIGARVGAPNPQDASDVARHLVTGMRAREVAVRLNELDEALEEEGGEARNGQSAVRRLFWWALRNAVDWTPYHVAHGATFADDSRTRDVPVSLELPFLSMTVAELVLAGLDDRPLGFEEPTRANDPPRGRTMHSLPATTLAPMFQLGGARTAEGVVCHLNRLIGEEQYRNRPPPTSDEEYEELRAHVERRLYALTYEGRKATRSPRYLVVTERDLGARAEAGQAWGVLQARLLRELPSLRVVLLRAGGHPDAESIATQVASMFSLSPPAP